MERMQNWEAAESYARVELTPVMKEYVDLSTQFLEVFDQAFAHSNRIRTRRSVASLVLNYLLAMMVTDLRVVTSLCLEGYSLQAAAIATGMFERAQLIAYVGDDSKRAIAWRDHQSELDWKPKKIRSSSDLIRLAVRAVAHMFSNDVELQRQIDRRKKLYRDLNLIKHGNPRMLRRVLGKKVGDQFQIYHGPLVGKDRHGLVKWVLVQALESSLHALLFLADNHLPTKAVTAMQKPLEDIDSRLTALRKRDLVQTP